MWREANLIWRLKNAGKHMGDCATACVICRKDFGFSHWREVLQPGCGV